MQKTEFLHNTWLRTVQVSNAKKREGTKEEQRAAHRQVMMAWFAYRSWVIATEES